MRCSPTLQAGTGTLQCAGEPAERCAPGSRHRPQPELGGREVSKIGVEFFGDREDVLPILEAALPPQTGDPFVLGQTLPETAREVVALPSMHDVVLEDEGDSPRRIHFDQPPVVCPSGPRPLDPVALLLEA